MSARTARPRQARARSLQQAAGTIFVLTAVLPFLIFVWILYTLDAMDDPRAQIGLGLSLLLSVLGFSVLRTTMRRTSEVLRLLVRAESGPETPPAPSPAASPRPQPDTPAVRENAAGPTRLKGAAASAASADSAPAIGSIQELRDATDAVARRWKRETEHLIGRPVVVSVINVDAPETGRVSRVTDDGVILEQDGMEFGVLWRLVSAVKLDPRAETPRPTDAAVSTS